jgi:WD40 repeat protein
MSADGSRFASADAKGGVTIWDAASGKKLSQLAGDAAVVATCFSPDGKSLAVASAKDVTVWNVDSAKKSATLPDVELLSRIHFDPSGARLLAVAGRDVLIWNAASLGGTSPLPRKIPVEVDQIDALAFSPDGGKFAVGGVEDASVWVFDTANGLELNQLNTR